MEKEFIPYKQSLALKELGFDEVCLSAFFENKIKRCDNIKNSTSDYVSAPLYQQAFRWLLKKHNLYGVIIPTITMYWTFKTITVVDGMIEVPPYSHVHNTDYETLEEAELECLKKLIEILKNK